MTEPAAEKRISSGKPRYLSLADALRDEILRGDYGGENPFPTENALCNRFGVSRFTVREALRALQGEQLIDRRRGSGTVVRPALGDEGRMHPQLSNIAEILSYARDTTFHFGIDGERTLPRRIARPDQLSEKERWITFSGLRHTNGQDRPIARTEGFIHGGLRDACARLEQKDMAIFRQIEILCGVKIVTIRQDIQSVAAGRRLAAGLRIALRSPCLKVLRRYIDDRGRVLLISESCHPGDRFAYGMHLDVQH